MLATEQCLNSITFLVNVPVLSENMYFTCERNIRITVSFNVYPRYELKTFAIFAVKWIHRRGSTKYLVFITLQIAKGSTNVVVKKIFRSHYVASLFVVADYSVSRATFLIQVTNKMRYHS